MSGKSLWWRGLPAPKKLRVILWRSTTHKHTHTHRAITILRCHATVSTACRVSGNNGNRAASSLGKSLFLFSPIVTANTDTTLLTSHRRSINLSYFVAYAVILGLNLLSNDKHLIWAVVASWINFRFTDRALTWAQVPLVAQAVEVITLTQLSPDFSKVTVVAHTLAAHTVSTPTADGRLGSFRIYRSAAAVLVCGVVVTLGTLAVWPQATRVAQADATLKGAITEIAFGAIGLGFGLALAVTLEGDSDVEGVLKADRFNDEWLLLLFGTTTGFGFHTERDLNKRGGLGFCVNPLCIM